MVFTIVKNNKNWCERGSAFFRRCNVFYRFSNDSLALSDASYRDFPDNLRRDSEVDQVRNSEKERGWYQRKENEPRNEREKN